VGFELRREVRDLLPRGGILTDKECRLILELADNCHEKTRMGWPGVEWLAAKCDIPNPKRTGEFFASIGRKWFELRVPLGKSKSGKLYYSKPGKRTTYRIPTRAELLATCPEMVPAMPGPSEIMVPPSGGPMVPATAGPVVPPTPEEWSPQQGDPFPHGFPQKDPQRTPSPPPTPSSSLAVVEAEIVEEEVGLTSSLEDQIHKLIDEAVALKPNWGTKRTEIRQQINALLGSFESLEAASVIVRETAKDPTSAHPSRITASGNPALVAANLALTVSHLDASTSGGRVLHPDAHRFEPSDRNPRDCLRCPFPKPNDRHRVGNQGGGYIAQRTGSYDREPHRPFRNPTDPGAYEGVL
jgi:hypothetical protein